MQSLRGGGKGEARGEGEERGQCGFGKLTAADISECKIVRQIFFFYCTTCILQLDVKKKMNNGTCIYMYTPHVNM